MRAALPPHQAPILVCVTGRENCQQRRVFTVSPSSHRLIDLETHKAVFTCAIFAERIGIPAAKKLRKDELEKAIVAFLRTGSAALPTKRSLRRTGVKDVERGLILKLRIENYTSNRETKDFIIEQARLKAPDVREKSGVWYRLNRTLSRTRCRDSRGSHGRYINFVADFLEAENGATRAEAIAAWNELKQLDVPKNYVSWVKARAKRKGKNR
jgi:hypothetical protein